MCVHISPNKRLLLCALSRWFVATATEFNKTPNVKYDRARVCVRVHVILCKDKTDLPKKNGKTGKHTKLLFLSPESSQRVGVRACDLFTRSN